MRTSLPLVLTVAALLRCATPVLAADAPVTSVEVDLSVPQAPHAGGIHVWLSGGGGLPGLNEEAVTGTDGRATIFTRRSGFSYVVARRKD